MPYSKQHLNEKTRSAKRNRRKGRSCPCAMCRFQSVQSGNVIQRHLEIFGRYDSELESGSDDQMEDAVSENLRSLYHDSSSSDANEGEQKRCRTQQSPSSVPSSINSVITSDRVCEVMHVLSDSSNKSEASENDRSEEKNNRPTTMLGDENDSTSSTESDCHDLFFNESSSPLIDSTSESEDDTNTTDTDVYASQTAKIPLYEKSEFTVLQTLAGYFHWFTEHPSTSKAALSDLLRLKKRILPQPNNLPGTYEEACNFVKPFLVPFETYHVCPNDCILFRKTSRYDYTKLTSCPVCGTKRYSANRKARRTFMYYPLGPRWRRMYGSASISEVLQNHQCGQGEKKTMRDIHDSPSWKQAFSEGKM